VSSMGSPVIAQRPPGTLSCGSEHARTVSKPNFAGCRNGTGGRSRFLRMAKAGVSLPVSANRSATRRRIDLTSKVSNAGSARARSG
jgi:hypothetical protein